MTTEPICQTCHKTHPWPDGTVPRHKFNPGGSQFQELAADKKPLPEVKESQWPFDPVLRQALIDKGILTPEDLFNAEAKIRAVTAQFTRGVQDDSGGTVSRP